MTGKTKSLIEQLGCLIMAAIVCVPAALIGVLLFGMAAHDAKQSTAVAALKPLSAAEIAATPPGTRVLAEGRIALDSTLAEPDKNLVMYVRETCHKSYGRKGRVRYSWSATDTARPDFQLVTAAGPAPILGRAYELRHPTLEEPHVSEVCVAWRGFQPGDDVVVDGTVLRGALKADVVFGGGHAAYVASLKDTSGSRWKLGAGLLVLAGVIAMAAAFYIVRSRVAAASAPGGVRA